MVQPTFDELSWKQKAAFALFCFANRLWTRVSPLAKQAFGIKQDLGGQFIPNVPRESFVLDNGHRSIKVTLEYLAEWEGEWEDAEG